MSGDASLPELHLASLEQEVEEAEENTLTADSSEMEDDEDDTGAEEEGEDSHALVPVLGDDEMQIDSSSPDPKTEIQEGKETKNSRKRRGIIILSAVDNSGRWGRGGFFRALDGRDPAIGEACKDFSFPHFQPQRDDQLCL